MNDNSKQVAGQSLGMPSILDRELDDRSGDAFGHQDFAIALRDLIEARTNKPPFSIGLLGPWGTGKSSIKALYRQDLESDKAGAVGNRRSDRVHVVTFNAWRFGGEQDLKRSLLREAFKQLGGDEAALRRALFEQVNKITQERRSFKNWLGETFGQILGSMIILIGLFVVTLAITWMFVWATGLKEQYPLTIVFMAATLLTGWLGKNIVDLRLRSPASFLPQTSISFPATSAEEYERLLTDQIAEFRRGIGQKCERLVVCVDDLDRLSAPEMVAGLDAIRTFLELPFNKSENGFGVVFVISCDEDKIAEAIKRRSGLSSSDLPGAVFSRGDARRYLDRLFQYRLEIPQFPKLDMRNFALNKLEGIESVASDLKKLNVSLEDVVDRLIHVDVQSPRNAIQLLNAFIQSWWIGSLRERNGVGSSAPGALHKGAVTDHPLSLAALCVLRVDFPDFYDAVQSRPEIIQEIRKMIFDGMFPSELAPRARELLRDFLISDEQGNLTGEVRGEYRKLRRYLSSLADLRWPKVLQPLLRLAEDPITRKFGDRAAAVFDNLVSGDVMGVLEAFGRGLDVKPLSDDDVILLEGFGEALPQETEMRRTNAARVLAALVDRIPQERRRRILSPLIRQMSALKTVRMNIQPERARQIVEGASADDRRDVAEKFVGDLLSSEPLDWRLATGGEPSLDEAIGAVRDTVELALEVKQSNGLPNSADVIFRRWLLNREIRLGGASRKLPFTDLEKWVEKYSDILLAYLASEYSDQAIGEFERAKTAPAFTTTVLPKISSIFESIAALGQDEREVLWSQLTRLVSVQPQAATEAAWSEAARYSSLAAPGKRQAFLIAFATRLCKEIEDGENWHLDGGQGATRFNDLCAEWRADIDAKTATELENIIVLWAKNVSREKFALRAFDVLKEQAKGSWDRIISALSQLELAARPRGVSSYLGSNFITIEAVGQGHLVEKMDAFINTNDLDKESIESYDTLVNGMLGATWSVVLLKDHLVRLLDRINAMHNNSAYISQLLPIASGVFKFAVDGKVGQSLTQLLTNAVCTPTAYVAVHRSLKGVWPEPSENIGNYNSQEIITRACQFIREQSGNAGIADVYESVCYIVQKRLPNADNNQEIADITPIVWRIAPEIFAVLSSFVAGILTPANAAEILTGAQAPKLESSGLVGLLAAISNAFGKDGRHDAAKRVLAFPPVPLLETPDGAFDLWVSACSECDPMFVIDLLATDDLNDEQTNRVLARIHDLALVGSPASVEALLKNTTRPKTRSALIGRLTQVIQACPSDSNRSGLASRMIASLPSLSGEELYSVARNVYDLGGASALERDDRTLGMLDNNQIDVLSKAFPTSRRIRDAVKKV